MTDRLCARLLFHQQQFSSGKLIVRPAQADDYLERKEYVAVKILVKAIEVAGGVVEQQWCRSHLAGVVAAVQEFGQIGWVSLR